MYKNNNAIPIPGNSMPTSGVSIDGKYDDVMPFSFVAICLTNILYVIFLFLSVILTFC